MPTFQPSILREIAHSKPISLRTRLLYRRRLQNRLQRLLRRAFRDEQKRTGLTQKELAERIGKDKSKVNQWLSIASNLTLETISDLLLGLGVDLDELSFTPIADLVHEAEDEEKTKERIRHSETAFNSFKNETKAHPSSTQVFLLGMTPQKGLPITATASILPRPSSGTTINPTA